MQNAQLEPQKAEKMWKTKVDTKNKDNKQKTITNMVDVTPTMINNHFEYQGSKYTN